MRDLLQKMSQLEDSAKKSTVKKKQILKESNQPVKTDIKEMSLKDMFKQLDEALAPGQKPIPVVSKAGDQSQTGAGFINITDQSPTGKALQTALSQLSPQQAQIVVPTQSGQQNQQQNKGGATTSTTQTSASQSQQNQQQNQQQVSEDDLDERDEGKPGKNFAKIAKKAAKEYGSKAAGERVAGAVRAKLAKQGKLEEVDMGQAERGMRKSTPHTGGYNVVDKAGKVISTHKGQRDAMQAALKNDDYSVKAIKEGAKVDRMVKHIAKSEREAGKSKDKAEDIAWATANKRGMLDNKNKKKVKEADIPSVAGVDTRGAGLGAGRSEKTLESKKPETEVEVIDNKFNRENYKHLIGKRYPKSKAPSYAQVKEVNEGKKSKPDFLDMDKDGDKKEPMKKAIKDKKKAVKENMSNRIRAARLEGKSHGLKGHQHCGKNYENMEECRAYHEGYKEGLDECYGMMDESYMMATPHMPETTHGMAHQELHDPYTNDMDEGNAFTGALARTPKGKTFSLGGKTFKDTSSLEEYAFEAWNRELETLINEGKKISESKKISKKSLTEGLTVSISKGQQGSPDSVNINATDSEADQVLSLIKQAGLGIFGGDSAHENLSDEPRGFSIQAPSSETNTPGDIEVVDDNEGMLGLMKKLSGIQGHDDENYDDEEESCENCGELVSNCQCDEDELNEVESEDQMTYEMAEDDNQPQNPADSGSANSKNATKGNDAANTAAAEYDASQKEENGSEEVDEDEDELEEGVDGYHQHEVKDKMKNLGNPFDNKPDNKLEEWANNAGKNNDEDWEADIDFMTKVISGGLNRQKSTGQTTVPVIAGQDSRMETPNDWAKLAGIKKA